jgi:hypothetical protein
MVIVITNRAPRINGGAGEGIPNARHAKPNAKARIRPTTDFIGCIPPGSSSPSV